MLEKVINELSALIHQDGEPFDIGCSNEEIDEIENYALNLPGFKCRRVVKNWQWWDLELSAAARKKLEVSGLRPVIIYANSVISDTSRGLSPGDWVRTTCLFELHKSCIFETNNSFYILVGKGTRKNADPHLALSLI